MGKSQAFFWRIDYCYVKTDDAVTFFSAWVKNLTNHK